MATHVPPAPLSRAHSALYSALASVHSMPPPASAALKATILLSWISALYRPERVMAPLCFATPSAVASSAFLSDSCARSSQHPSQSLRFCFT